MSTKLDPINKIFLLLQSNGSLVLDREHLWNGCDTPKLDPSIEMPPISVRELCELLRSRNLEWPEQIEAEKLKTLLQELKESQAIIEETIRQIEIKS